MNRGRIPRLLAFLLLIPLQDRPPPSPQERFGHELMRLLSSADPGPLHERVRSAPHRTAALIQDLLRQASYEDRPEKTLAGTRRIARVLAEEGFPSELESVDRFEAMGAEGPRKRKEIEELHLQAVRAASQGRFPEAENGALKAREAASRMGEPFLEARERRLLGQLAIDQGKLEEAERELLAALELDRERPAPFERAQDLKFLGDIQFRRGQYLPALERYEESRGCVAGLDEPAPVSLAEMGALYSNLGRYEEARRFFEEASRAAGRDGNRSQQSYLLAARGMLESARGNYAGGVDFLLRSLDASREARDPLSEASALVQLGSIYSEVGRFADALDSLEGALRMLDPRKAPLQRGFALLYQGLAFLDSGRPDAALAPLEEARRLLEKAGHAAGRAESFHHRARAGLERGEAEEAESLFRKAAEEREAHVDPFGASLSHTGLGEVLESEGKSQEARRAFEKALRLASSLDAPEASWRARAGLGRVAEAEGRIEEALAAFLAAVEELENVRNRLAVPSLRVRYLGDKLSPYRRASRILARAGRLEEGFRLSEACKARTLLELGSYRPSEERPVREGPSVRKLEEAESRFHLLNLRYADALRQRRGESTVARLREELRQARAALEEARLQWELESPRDASLAGAGKPPTLSEVQEALPQGARLLEFLLGPEGAAVWVVGKREIRFQDLAVSEAEVEELVRRIYRPIELLRGGELDLPNLGFDVRAASLLYEKLLDPVRPLLEGAEQLWIVPEGPLRRLPFSLLVTGQEKRPVDPGLLFSQYGGCRFLVEEFAVGTMPAAGLISRTRDRSAEPELERSFLAILDPDPLPPGSPRLKGARSEAASFRSSGAWRGGRVLSGEEAGEHAFKMWAPGFGFLHVAAHGLLDDARPAFSRLALSPGDGEDGWLHAYEVEGLSIGARCVVLSACETMGSAGRGEGLLGLSRAFLQAGADSVLCTAWAVDDEAAAFVTERFYGALGEGLEPVKALQKAQTGCIGEGRRPGLLLVHPFFWAAFVLCGR